MEKNQIIVHYGTELPDMVPALIKAAGLHRLIRPEMRIGIKPNLVVAKPADSGATTSPAIVEYILRFLLDRGCTNVFIGESSWVGEQTKNAFTTCGYDNLAREYGIPLIDLNITSGRRIKSGREELIVSREIHESDLLINVPVLKGHCQVKMTCAMKNLKGCIPNEEKRRYHRLGIHRPVAELNSIIPPQFIMVDAQQGDLSFEEGGTPVRMDRLIAGYDPVLIDTYCAELMGFSPDEIEYIRLGEELGIGSTDLNAAEIIEMGRDKKGAVVADSIPDISSLTRYVTQREACSACYGSLIHALSRLQERGILKKLRTPLFVGQHYRGTKEDGIGVGKCTEDFNSTIPGCPPKAITIYEHIRDQLG